ncbi:MAG: C2 family cysteine protease [Candidatus Thiodiazotropha sp.]
MNQTITNISLIKATTLADRTSNTTQQTRGQILWHKTNLSSEREQLVKEAFSHCCSNEKQQLADDFVKEAKREGLNNLAETPDGQYALAEVYRHASKDSAELMRDVNREQGSTAVNYTKGPGVTLNIPDFLPSTFYDPNNWDFTYDRPDPAPESDDIYGGRDWGLDENAQLYVNGISYNDIRQGAVGDCSMMATIASVASLNPNFIRDTIIDNHNDTYTVRLYSSHGNAKYFTVDGELYREPNGTPVYAHSGQLNEIWPAIIEKAYAEMEGGYTNIRNRTATDTIRALTGKRSDYISNQIPASILYQGIHRSLANGNPVIASSYNDASRYSGMQIVEYHSYSVLGANEDNNGQQWIILRNPWGEFEYLNSNYNTGVLNRNDGVFRMKIEDYCQLFQGTTLNSRPKQYKY